MHEWLTRWKSSSRKCGLLGVEINIIIFCLLYPREALLIRKSALRFLSSHVWYFDTKTKTIYDIKPWRTLAALKQEQEVHYQNKIHLKFRMVWVTQMYFWSRCCCSGWHDRLLLHKTLVMSVIWEVQLDKEGQQESYAALDITMFHFYMMLHSPRQMLSGGYTQQGM